MLVSAALLGVLTGCAPSHAAPTTTAQTATATITPTPSPTPTPNPTQSAAFAALQVGDCLDTPAGSDEFEDTTFTVVPCAAPHVSELFGMPVVGSGAYPGDDGVIAASENACSGIFTSYVGVSVYSTTSLDYSVYTPSEADWNAGHSQAGCVIFSPDGDLLGSVKGIGASTPKLAP